MSFGFTEMPIEWMIWISFFTGVTALHQDLRDTEGDPAAGRQTVVHALGQSNTRLLISVAYVGCIFVTVCFISFEGIAAYVYLVFITSTGLLLCVGLFRDKSHEADRFRYEMHILWIGALWLQISFVLKSDGRG